MFHKTKCEHHILTQFHRFIMELEKYPDIDRIIPGKIDRKQSGKSGQRINFSYLTNTGLKYKLCKGSTAQELFVIVKKGTYNTVKEYINTISHKYII